MQAKPCFIYLTGTTRPGFLSSTLFSFPFCVGVSLLKLNGRKKRTLIIEGLLGNLVKVKPRF